MSYAEVDDGVGLYGSQILTFHGQRTITCPDKTRYHPEQRGFSGTVGSDDRYRFPLFNSQIDIE
jgi:hypothetical protein